MRGVQRCITFSIISVVAGTTPLHYQELSANLLIPTTSHTHNLVSVGKADPGSCELEYDQYHHQEDILRGTGVWSYDDRATAI